MRRAMQAIELQSGRLASADAPARPVAAAIERVKPVRALPPHAEINAALLLDAAASRRGAFTPVSAYAEPPIG